MPKERQTCTECSMRRQKCDRNSPCGRCVKRGDADKCTREWPDGGYDPKVHRIYPRPEQQRSQSLDQASPGSARSVPVTATAKGNESILHPSLRTPPPNVSGAGLGPAQASRFRLDGRENTMQAPQGPVTGIDNAASVLEFLSWGRSKLSDYDMKSLELLKEPHNSVKDTGTDWDVSNGFGGTGAAQMSFLQLLLPSQRQVFQLVEYHLGSILWYHASFHGPTFYQELTEVFKNSNGLQVRETDLRWTALLFSVMAASMTCCSEQIALSWGFQKNERAKLTRQWYKATVSCLNLADYMWRHHIHSVEAIMVLTMSAHILGFSNTQSTLLGAALKIAQGLGLQRLGPEDENQSITSGTGRLVTQAQKDRIIRRENGRRAWSQLCIQDWFSIPFSEMYSIQAIHFTSLKPQAYDERTMLRIPETIPSDVSFGNFLNEIAALMPQMHDAVAVSSTLYTKYEQVLEYDAKMRALATETIPPFFSMRETIDPEWPAFIPWARRSLTICFAHKIIMIHRPFLGRSFSEPTFDFTRRTCMAAAKTILKEARQAYDEEGPMLWIDQAFMVAAGITLALDVFHRKANEPEFDEHRKLIETTVGMLGKFDNSMIALRGIRLLSSLLTEQARLAADQTLDNYRKRVHESNNNNSAGTGAGGGAQKKQKFDVPKFVESFVGNDSFTHSLRTAQKGRGEVPSSESYETPTTLNQATMAATDHAQEGEELLQLQQQDTLAMDFGYETFEQLFPPQAGISNSFLFEDLLNFDI